MLTFFLDGLALADTTGHQFNIKTTFDVNTLTRCSPWCATARTHSLRIEYVSQDLSCLSWALAVGYVTGNRFVLVLTLDPARRRSEEEMVAAYEANYSS
jgi:hypothetical protein